MMMTRMMKTMKMTKLMEATTVAMKMTGMADGEDDDEVEYL